MLYEVITDEVRKGGMLTMATPFDEESIELITKLEIDIIKIASCSVCDWPLLEEVVKVNKPVVISTAGVNANVIDQVVSLFDRITSYNVCYTKLLR